MQNNSFRQDINGLRAIAVIAVVLFHFNASWMPGGFAGVDVFFVISGFLMTGIIFRGIEQENFSILKFYVARANRIIPALAVLCLVLLIFGWFYLTPIEYRALGKHSASSISFLSNFIYWTESGYFDAASHEKWLLHTWSLSVEWQFYILYPLVLVAMRKFMSIKTMKFLLVVGTVLGFVFCIVATYKWPNPSYYLLPTRAWEMMIGGIAYLYPFTPQENRKKIIEFIGLSLIIGSYFLISSENLWPGYLAIFPVLGSFLLIQANRNNSVVTNNLVFQKLGTWSYSIYLWHWPIVVAIYIFSLSEIYTYLGVILSIILGFLSYQYIEKIKFRNNFSNFFSYFKHKPIYMVFILCAISSIIFFNEGLNRNTSILKKYEKYNWTHHCHVIKGLNDSSDLNRNINCKLGSKFSQPLGLVWGDSYAGHLDPFIINILNENQSFSSRTTSACAASTELTNSLGGNPEYCKKIRQKTLQEIKNKKYQVIFIGGRWEDTYTKYGDRGFNGVLDAIDLAAKNAEIVYVIAQPIYYQKNVSKVYLSSKISSLYPSELIRNDQLPIKMNQKLKKAINKNNYKNVYFVTRDILYGSSNYSDFTSSGMPFTFDNGHLSDIGSIEMSNNFMQSEISMPLKTKFPELIKKSF
jgi:peptidoglycan/LPS O-acetylase OafA/YrhL